MAKFVSSFYRQQKTETHSARKRSDPEPTRLLVKGQRYFDDPYEVYDSRELTSNELVSVLLLHRKSVGESTADD